MDHESEVWRWPKLAAAHDDKVGVHFELSCETPEFDFGAAADGGEATIPTFTMLAYAGGVMQLGMFSDPVVIDLEGITLGAAELPVRLNHDADQGVGHITKLEIQKRGVIASGLISRDTEAAREVIRSAKRGFPWRASIAGNVQRAEFVEAGSSVKVNGKKVVGPVRVIRATELAEVSFVDMGADRSAHASIRATAQEEDMKSTESKAGGGGANDAIVATSAGADDDAGKNKETTSSGTATNTGQAPVDVKKIEASASNTADPVVTPDPVQEMRGRAADEVDRIAKVGKAAGEDTSLRAKAIREGWSADKTELESLRAARPKAPAIHVRDEHVEANVLECACLQAAKTSAVEKLFDEKVLEAASKRFRSGISLQELFLEAAWANGYTGRTFRDKREVMRAAFGKGSFQAGWSTIDLGGILGNVANKFLLEGFFSVERVWRDITAVRSVSDFKTVTSYRLLGIDQYEIVPPGGELKHGTLGEESFTNQADTYGLLLSISRTDIINDDLGAITSVPRKLGRGAGLKINDVFWTEFLDNSSFFAAGNSNYFEGADTLLSVEGLTTGEQTFMDLKDPEGKPIGHVPTLLVVPTAVSAIAAQLFNSLEIRNIDEGRAYPINNPHANKFAVHVSRYLGNSAYGGYSATAWYLLADPRDLPVIEVAFLNGQEAPTIESTDADFNVLGVQFRGYHDFGVNKQDTRGGVKSKGSA